MQHHHVLVRRSLGPLSARRFTLHLGGVTDDCVGFSWRVRSVSQSNFKGDSLCSMFPTPFVADRNRDRGLPTFPRRYHTVGTSGRRIATLSLSPSALPFSKPPTIPLAIDGRSVYL